MTTVASLITDAFREGNIIAVGATPSSPQQTEGLAKLNSFMESLFGVGVGLNLSDWLVPQPQRTSSVPAQWPLAPDSNTDQTSDIYDNPPQNVRIVWGGVNATVYFPQAPNDGARMAVVQGSGAGSSGVTGATLTLDGNGRTIAGADTATLTNPALPTSWLYRADLGDWKELKTLALTDDSILPAQFDELIILNVFFRLSPRYGKAIRPDQISAEQSAMKNLKAKYFQTENVVTNDKNWREPLQSFGPRLRGGWMN